MPTVIDSLVVQLGFDTKGVKKGEEDANLALKRVKESAASTAKDMESRGKQAGEFFGQISSKIIGLAAAAVGLEALKSRIVDTATSVAALGRAAVVTGANVKDLSAFAMAIERNGGNAAAATQEVEGFIAAVERWKTLGQADDGLKMFLGTIGAGPNTSWLDALKLFADYAEKNKADPARVALIGKMGGLGQNTISELMKGGAAFSADLERSRQLGIATEKDVEAARKFQDSLAALGQILNTITRELVVGLEPWLSKFVGWASSQTPEHVGGPFTAEPSVTITPDGKRVFKPVNPFRGAAPATPTPGSEPGGAPLSLFEKLEGSGDNAVSSKGAVGRYQITPDTARTYGFDPDRLKDPAYNKQAATAILADLMKRYNGDLDAVAIAYHSGPKAADRWLASGRDDETLGPKTLNYLHRERTLTSAGARDSLGPVPGKQSSNTTSTVTVGSVTIVTQATDGKGIARDFSAAMATQANTGLG